MGRVSKLLRSRFFLAAACIVLEFAQLLAVFILLYEFFLPITILGWVFYVGVMLYLINRDEIPECKLPWLVILCFLPVIGAFVYMLLSSDRTSEKEYRCYQAAGQALRPYRERGGEMARLREQDLGAYRQARYLSDAAGMPCRTGTAVTYYPLGERFYTALLADLEGAGQFILMEYFIVQEGRMWDGIHRILRQKAAQGVEVFFLYDDFGCMTTLPEGYDKQLESEGIHCQPANRFTPILSHIHNNRDHRKITVIDGRVGYTGGINLADEYINAVEKHGHWKDSAVRLEGPAVQNLTMLFLTSWNGQGGRQLDGGAYLRPAPPGRKAGCVIPFGDGPKPLYPDRIGKNVYLNLIYAAQDYLYLTTPYLICDQELLNALRLAAKKGVDVRVITPHIPDKRAVFLMTRSNYRALMEDGVRIYEYTPGFCHAKNWVCDDRFAACGTINLDYRSLVHHFECGVWMYDVDAVGEMKADFERTLALCQSVVDPGAGLKRWQRLLAEVMKIFSPLL